MKEYFLPPVFFDEIRSFAEKNNFVELEKIVDKNTDGSIFLEHWEAQMLVNLAKLWHLQALLKYPFWDADHPNYDPDHEEKFMEEQEERWGKISMTFSDF